jgi:hypothetical protein
LGYVDIDFSLNVCKDSSGGSATSFEFCSFGCGKNVDHVPRGGVWFNVGTSYIQNSTGLAIPPFRASLKTTKASSIVVCLLSSTESSFQTGKQCTCRNGGASLMLGVRMSPANAVVVSWAHFSPQQPVSCILAPPGLQPPQGGRTYHKGGLGFSALEFRDPNPVAAGLMSHLLKLGLFCARGRYEDEIRGFYERYSLHCNNTPR